MGVSISFLPFLDALADRGAWASPVLGLGSQTIHDPLTTLRKFAKQHSYARLADDPRSVRCLLHDRYAVADYRDCDLNDAADLMLDLGRPVEAALKGSFRTILDAGTLEHVFDLQVAFRNIHDLLMPGGCAIHISPMTWHDHGFVNFNPRIFHRIMAANSYQSVAEGFHYPTWRGTTVVLTEPGASPAALAKIWAKRRIPPAVLLLIAYRKVTDAAFAIPYDIQD